MDPLTQLMGVGRVEMGVVSLLLPGCCHGDADGAFSASWDFHLRQTTHRVTHTLTPSFHWCTHEHTFWEPLPLRLLLSTQEKKRERKGILFQRLEVCACEGASVNTPMRDTRRVCIRHAHGKLASDSLLQSAACSLSFLRFSLSFLCTLHSPPPLTTHTSHSSPRCPFF